MGGTFDRLHSVAEGGPWMEEGLTEYILLNVDVLSVSFTGYSPVHNPTQFVIICGIDLHPLRYT